MVYDIKDIPKRESDENLFGKPTLDKWLLFARMQIYKNV